MVEQYAQPAENNQILLYIFVFVLLVGVVAWLMIKPVDDIDGDEDFMS